MPRFIKKTHFKKFAWFALTIFVIMNIVAYVHAYKFTHFSTTAQTKTKDPSELGFGEKLKTLFTGIDNPRPVNKSQPDTVFETITIQAQKKLECWSIKINQPVGTVIVFHGYTGEKSSLLGQAKLFRQLGYNTILVDFEGSGGSEGSATTLGFYEAEQVKAVYDYLEKQNEKNIILFGNSMGAVAIMKAINDYNLPVKGLILECPFGTMYKTVAARFKTMQVPTFPMAHLLVFWGGVQNNFNAFKHEPELYAKNIHCPVLLLSGENDEKVSIEEINTIYNNLQGKKEKHLFPRARHENYLKHHATEWYDYVKAFLKNN